MGKAVTGNVGGHTRAIPCTGHRGLRRDAHSGEWGAVGGEKQDILTAKDASDGVEETTFGR